MKLKVSTFDSAAVYSLVPSGCREFTGNDPNARILLNFKVLSQPPSYGRFSIPVPLFEPAEIEALFDFRNRFVDVQE